MSTYNGDYGTGDRVIERCLKSLHALGERERAEELRTWYGANDEVASRKEWEQLAEERARENETLRARLSRQQEWIDAVMGQNEIVISDYHGQVTVTGLIIRPQPLAKE